MIALKTIEPTGEHGPGIVELNEAAITLRNVHPRSACTGRTCWVHTPTTFEPGHPMFEWPYIIRDDRTPVLIERQCPHGIGHPDPDQRDWFTAVLRAEHGADVKSVRDEVDGLFIHGCDGCCFTRRA